MKRIQFIDTTLRDGQQSLWALNMTTGMMLPALPHIDEAGYEAIEFYAPVVMMKKKIRDLRENPWQWLKLGTAKPHKTQFRMHGGFRSGFIKVPEAVSKLLIQKVVEHGITVNRTSNPWNDFDEFKVYSDELKKLGMNCVVNFIYSESPRHTDEYFIERAKKAAKMNFYRVCFKDVGGLLTPERTRQLLPKIKAALGDVELEFHAHCNNGLGPINALEAAKLGITHIHTAIPPLANGSSQPSIFNVANNIRSLGYEADINLEPLKHVQEHFTNIAKRENLPIGVPFEYDQSLYRHQVPGGMISNLRFQLQKVGMEDRLEETLEEAMQVRADLGYPIMVTPLAQFVGSQAGINVITGARYEVVTDQLIQYAYGYWGKEAVEVMDPNVRAKILDRPRAKEFANWTPNTDSLEEVRKKYGKNLTDEELILLMYVDEEAVTIAREAPVPRPYITTEHPIVQLVQELAQKRDKRFISIQKGGFSLKLSIQ